MTDENEPRAAVSMWLAHPLEPSVRKSLDRVSGLEDVVRLAVMPDVHLAFDVCVGVAMATDRLVYPAAVGGDIGCGMLAIGFELPAAALRAPARAGTLLRRLHQTIPIHRRQRAALSPWPDNLPIPQLSHRTLQGTAEAEGRLQLGTLGGGNHFVELQADEDDRLWLMIHSGSRAMGQAIRAHHLARATVGSGSLAALDSSEADGEAYLNDVEWARRYADANRRAMANAVVAIVEEVFAASAVSGLTLSVDHNHVGREVHDGRQMLVHRKGAMPADAGSPGVLPGSMGTLSFHVEGRGCPESLRSSAHGAGRRFSRQAARDRFTRQDLRQQMTGVWFDPRLEEALRDESPRAYKDVKAVLRAQSDLVKVTRTLRPLLVHKGGGNQ